MKILHMKEIQYRLHMKKCCKKSCKQSQPVELPNNFNQRLALSILHLKCRNVWFEASQRSCAMSLCATLLLK